MISTINNNKYICINNKFYYEDGDIANALITKDIIKKSNNHKYIDIGVDKGWWTQWVLAYDPDATIQCFEPNPISYQTLLTTFQNMSNVKVFPYAISSENSTLVLSLLNGQSHSREISDMVSTVSVECKTIDTFIPTTETIELIKIDTEGHEVKILESLLPFIEEKRVNYIISEFTPHWYTSSPSEVIDLVVPIFFQMFESVSSMYFLSRTSNYLIGPLTLDYIRDYIYIFFDKKIQTDILINIKELITDMKILPYFQYKQSILSNPEFQY
jgi:FkbM family methyltransferase